MAEIFI
jgi:hypothetical protein